MSFHASGAGLDFLQLIAATVFSGFLLGFGGTLGVRLCTYLWPVPPRVLALATVTTRKDGET